MRRDRPRRPRAGSPGEVRDSVRAVSPEVETGDARERPRGLTPSGSRLIVAAFAASCATIIVLHPRGDPSGPLRRPSGRRRRRRPSRRISKRMRGRPPSRRPSRGRGSRASGGSIASKDSRRSARGERPEVGRERWLGLTRLLNILEREHEGATDALRGAALSDLWPALRGDLEPEEERALLGGFPRMLERYGAARDGASPRAPERRARSVQGALEYRPRAGADGWVFSRTRLRHIGVGPRCTHPRRQTKRRGVDVRGLAMAEYARGGGPHARELAGVRGVPGGRVRSGGGHLRSAPRSDRGAALSEPYEGGALDWRESDDLRPALDLGREGLVPTRHGKLSPTPAHAVPTRSTGSVRSTGWRRDDALRPRDDHPWPVVSRCSAWTFSRTKWSSPRPARWSRVTSRLGWRSR